MKIRLLLVISLLGLLPLPLSAITVNGLYQTSVVVADESAAVRVEAMQLAMQQVLVKLSGDSKIATVSGAEEIIKRAQQFVQQFRYKRAGTTKAGIQGETELQVKFDETALNSEIRNYALPLWGQERPAVLVWMALDNAAGRNIVSLEDNPDIIDFVDATAAARGIPLLFPLMDLEDTARMNVSDLWGDFEQPIVAASARYQSDAIAVGRITQGGAAGWQTQWTLYMDQQASRWSTENTDVALALEEAIDLLADALAERYVNSGSSGTELFEIAVSNILTHDDYARTVTYLESLQSVTQVVVKTVMPEQVKFELVSHGGQDALDRAIRLGNVLKQSGQQRYVLQDGF